MENKVSGNFLKQFREYYGLTQAEFAEVLGFSVRTVQNWELRGLPFNTFRLIKAIFIICRWKVDDQSDGVTTTEKSRKDQTVREVKSIMEYF